MLLSPALQTMATKNGGMNHHLPDLHRLQPSRREARPDENPGHSCPPRRESRPFLPEFLSSSHLRAQATRNRLVTTCIRDLMISNQVAIAFNIWPATSSIRDNPTKFQENMHGDRAGGLLRGGGQRGCRWGTPSSLGTIPRSMDVRDMSFFSNLSFDSAIGKGKNNPISGNAKEEERRNHGTASFLRKFANTKSFGCLGRSKRMMEYV